MRDIWKIWRYCIVCQSKFFGTEDNLKFGPCESDSKTLCFYLLCQVCHATNTLEESLIPPTEKGIVKKEFYRQKKEERQGRI